MIGKLQNSDTVVASRPIMRAQVMNWKHSFECFQHFSEFVPGTRFIVRDMNKNFGFEKGDELWVKLEVPGSNPPVFLKVSGNEFANFFKLP